MYGESQVVGSSMSSWTLPLSTGLLEQLCMSPWRDPLAVAASHSVQPQATGDVREMITLSQFSKQKLFLSCMHRNHSFTYSFMAF